MTTTAAPDAEESRPTTALRRPPDATRAQRASNRRLGLALAVVAAATLMTVVGAAVVVHDLTDANVTTQSG
jgi:hypothetical protein